MLTVMIVEDEMLVRMGLSVSIDWEKRNMRLVAEVGNGNDGYYAFLRHRPNIVITDIRMPGMDGLTLIQKIRELDRSCRIIVISCMTDFATLHEAMQYDISSYLIKATMTQDNIRDALDKTTDDFSRLEQVTESTGSQDRSQILADLVARYLTLHSVTYRQLVSSLTREGIPLPPPTGLLTVYRNVVSTEQMMLKSVCHLIENALSLTRETNYFISDHCLIFFTNTFLSDSIDGPIQALNDVYNYIKENFSQHLRFVYSTEEISLESMPVYLERVLALGSRAYLFDTPVLSVDHNGEIADRDINGWFEHLQVCASQLRLDPKLYSDYLNAVQNAYRSLGQPRSEVLKCLYEVTVLLAQNNRKITPDQLTCCHHYLSKAQSLRSMMSIIDKQILAFAGAPVTPYTHLLSDAVGYMVDNLESDLSLTSVAAHVNLSPGYFSTLLNSAGASKSVSACHPAAGGIYEACSVPAQVLSVQNLYRLHDPVHFRSGLSAHTSCNPAIRLHAEKAAGGRHDRRLFLFDPADRKHAGFLPQKRARPYADCRCARLSDRRVFNTA